MEKELYFPHLWIEQKLKPQCLQYSSVCTGIRISYDDNIDTELIEQTNDLVKYLRKNYYFPIRCNIAVTNHKRYYSAKDGHIYYGIFYDNANAYPKRKLYPRIAVAGQLWKHNSIADVHFTLLHELTHYFQWFFAEDKDRTDRSLEIEANRWSNYIFHCFQNQQ